MRTNKQSIYWLLSFSLFLLAPVLAGCKGDNNSLQEESVVRVEPYRPTDLDDYLVKYFSQPYGVEISYRFNENEYNRRFTFTPPAEDKVIIFTNVLNYLFYEPYSKVFGQEFLALYSPKLFVLSGNYGYGQGTTYTRGIAESAGVKLSFLGLNNLNINNLEDLNEVYLRLIYHEASHALHQKTPYPREFTEISALDYKTSDAFAYWRRTGESFLRGGFISAYASQEPSEDFAETIGRYMIYDDARWAQILTEADGKNDPNAARTGREIILQKLEIIKKYLLDEWDYDLEVIRAEVQSRWAGMATMDFTQRQTHRD